MNKIITLLCGIIIVSVFSSCSTLSTASVKDAEKAVFSYVYKGYNYDKLFNAALYAFNTNNETVVSADRDSGIIHTRVFSKSGILAVDAYYLITKGDNEVIYSASAFFERQRRIDQNEAYQAMDSYIYSGTDREANWIRANKNTVRKEIEEMKNNWQENQELIVAKILEACVKLYGLVKGK